LSKNSRAEWNYFKWGIDYVVNSSGNAPPPVDTFGRGENGRTLKVGSGTGPGSGVLGVFVRRGTAHLVIMPRVGVTAVLFRLASRPTIRAPARFRVMAF